MIRTVTLSDGRQYEHRCSRENFEAVLYHLQEQGEGTMPGIAQWLELPYTQVDVALGFLKERGCVTVFSRRSHPASKFLFEDGMTEWYALVYGGG